MPYAIEHMLDCNFAIYIYIYIYIYISKHGVCLSVWVVPGKFFQSLPIPYGVLCRRGGGWVS